MPSMSATQTIASAFRNVRPGFYEVDDCDTRSRTVTQFDGQNWWFPGSALPFSTVTMEGRFQMLRDLNVQAQQYGAWKPENGRFT